MFDSYSMGNPVNDRKQALIKKLAGQNRGSGGAARLSNGMPFGALPRLGFNPNARSVFGRGEQFNFTGGPPGFDQASGMGQAGGQLSEFTPPGQGGAPPAQNQPLGGIGPAAGDGSGSPGLPQGAGAPAPSAGLQSSYGNDAGTTHLLENGGNPASAQGATGAVPLSVQQALANGNLNGGVSAWLAANPWFAAQLGIDPQYGGGAVL